MLELQGRGTYDVEMDRQTDKSTAHVDLSNGTT